MTGMVYNEGGMVSGNNGRINLWMKYKKEQSIMGTDPHS